MTPRGFASTNRALNGTKSKWDSERRSDGGLTSNRILKADFCYGGWYKIPMPN